MEGRIIFDVDGGTTTTYQATDGSRNYYFYSFRKDDLQEIADYNTGQTFTGATPGRIQKALYDKFNSGPHTMVVDTETKQTESFEAAFKDRSFGMVKSRKLLDKLRQLNPSGKPFQAGSGKEQWYQLRIKVRDLKRIGEDKTKTLADVRSVMISAQVTRTNPASTVEFAFSSIAIS